ncbi:unnamed protein product [Cylicocyclus nassatus]|uniref:Uncharacterized protein n=1 Tax=Cylicocyclus nassatus TaxID=53992 RepID=A0AA36H931_CYLNA|nr:unnamed protein product [Cylicocyclus nassatus]
MAAEAERIERVLILAVVVSKDYILTKLTAMKGCGCKCQKMYVTHIDLVVLLELLKTFDTNFVIDGEGVGIGLDSCVVPLRHQGLNLVHTTDFFYPLVDELYLMGRVTCANVLSDLYAMAVVNCVNMLMLLGVAVDLDEQERNVIVRMSMERFEKKNGRVEEYDLDEKKINRAYQEVVEQMTRLNRNAAKMLHKYNAHASTDVSGFGILAWKVFAEIPLLLYMLTSFLRYPVLQNLMYEKVCLAYHDQDLSFCLNVSAFHSKVIQAGANHFYFNHPSYCFRHSFQL